METIKQIPTTLRRTCGLCEKTVTYKNYSRHLRTKTHEKKQRNNPDVIIETRFHKKTKQKLANEITKPRKELTIKPHRVFCGFKKDIFEQKPPRIIKRNNIYFEHKIPTHVIFQKLDNSLFVKAKPSTLKVVDITTKKRTAFNRKVFSFIVENKRQFKDIIQFLNYSKNYVEKKMLTYLKEMGNFKVTITLVCNYIKKKPSLEEFTTYFTTENERYLDTSNFNDFYNSVKETIQTREDGFMAKGSGWIFNNVINMDVNMCKYNPLRGASYIELPKKIANKKAIVNIKNEDNKCFLWTILAALHPVTKDANRVSKYKEWENEFDEVFKKLKIQFPVKLKDVTKFGRETNMSINVFTCNEKENIVPLQICNTEEETHVNLFYLSEKNKEHYCLILNLSRLVGAQKSRHVHKTYLCNMCLSHFRGEEELTTHKEYCKNNKCVRTILPTKLESTLQFENYTHSYKVPFTIYADFESRLPKLDTCQPSDETSYTNTCQKHLPTSFCYNVINNNSSKNNLVTYSGEDAAKVFYKKITKEAIYIANTYLDVKKPMEITKEQEKEYTKENNCHICEKPFNVLPPLLDKQLEKFKAKNYCITDLVTARVYSSIDGEKETNKELDNFLLNLDENMKKVRDHCHLTGKYRGAAHSICNLNYKVPRFIPVFFHNLSGYDGHLFIKEFGVDKDDIKVISNSEEKYISFSKILRYQKFDAVTKAPVLDEKNKPVFKTVELRFLDSFKFLSSSLEKLANNLEKGQFKHLSKFIENIEQQDLVKRKLAYPYEYMDSPEKYNEESLPSIDKFYSTLTGENVDKNAYENAQKIWTSFKIKNMRQFTILYNTLDVLLLTDVMENYRIVSLERFKLDPVHYYTTPGFAWNAMLRKTDVKLELLTDINMYLMFEQGIRGGLSQCSIRHSKTTNKYITDECKQEKTLPKYLLDLDANNLYGWAMCKYLPYKGFKWNNNLSSFTTENILQMEEEQEKGYIFEVDLKYPEHLHDLHSDFPLAPENTFDNKKLPKLTTTLYDKKKYILHYVNLKLYLRLGLKLERIHRVIEFVQKDWLKPYIEFNTNLRSETNNEFEKDYYKLMNNSVFGRTMMNTRNFKDLKLISDEEKVEKWVSKPTFDRATIFTENLVAVHMKKTEVVLKQPIYLGMCILDLSKTRMYDFYYNVLKNVYGQNIRLLYTDTDSLIVEITTEDFYTDVRDNKQLLNEFDFSGYPENNKYGIPRINKKVLGKFKDELNGQIMSEFVGLRAKLYSIKIFDNKNEIKRAKGVKKPIVKNVLCFNDFYNCLVNKNAKYIKQNTFRTNKHEIYTVEQNKKALSAYDDKRYILDNGVDTVAWGHYSTKIKRENFREYLDNLIKTNNKK